jgi:tetratricopeptide (TPR) repeat protein
MPRRQRLHARVADAIERLYGPNLDRRASVLAHHLYQAGASADLEKAIHYLMLAATLARTGAAHEEALAHMDNALSLLAEEQHPHKAELHAARAIALRSLARSAEAIEAYEHAIAGFMTGPICRNSPKPRWIWHPSIGFRENVAAQCQDKARNSLSKSKSVLLIEIRRVRSYELQFSGGNS